MVRRGTTRTAAPAPEPEDEGDEFPLAHLLDKDPSEVHNRFCDWIGEQTGEPEVADPKTVQLVISQWQKFQKTPDQQEYTKARKEASAAAAEERERKRADAPAERPTRTRASKATASEEEAPAPRRAGKVARGQVTPPPAKRATTRRRPAAAAASVPD